ncbi:DgyrCDS9658 [Dimorphilus gyrociliatus]|uniref:DgyrCDS9658 n=1 Tax=Dimorphilus gyrociliatus TaxID=2664684 RepID=A0A7I8W2X5_9ANNE|nr:DgyrCDS9658 [Dimorphilus gyrociliatus]
MGNIHTVGPNNALVISGGCCGSRRSKTIIGGWGWAWWFVTDVQCISLEVMTLNPVCENVETSEGVPITVTGVAQIKIITERELLNTACEQFLGKSVHHIETVILQTLEGHLRAILGTLSVEAIYQDRDKFALQVREFAAPDVGRMGIEILSFTIKDVYDNVEYLASLGRAQTANVKKDADVGVAEATRDAGIRESECENTRKNAKFLADTKIAESKRTFETQKAEYDGEVNAKLAQAELAYELNAAKMRQKIRAEELEIDVIDRKKQIDIEEKEIQRKEKELIATVRRPAEAEAYKMETIAEAHRFQTVAAAEAEAEKIRLLGSGDAAAIESIGKAEADRMKMKAVAYKQYGEAAKLSLVLENMPKIARAVAAPLSKTDNIVLLGEDRTTTEVTKLVSNLPPAVQALTGIDLKELLKVPGRMV